MAANDGGPDLPANAPVDGDGDAGGPYIPAELVPDIAKHLTSLHDFFALRAGCRAYRAALPKCRALLALQPPHLLVPHTADPSLPLFKLLEPGCAAFSLALFHTPDRRLLRFRARLPFSKVVGVLTSDAARVASDDGATGEISLALFHTPVAASSASAPASEIGRPHLRRCPRRRRRRRHRRDPTT